MAINENAPSLSPSKPEGKTLDNALEKIKFLQGVEDEIYESDYKISQKVFAYLDKQNRSDVLNGNIPDATEEDIEVAEYIEPLRRLFSIAINKETGGTKNMNREVVQAFDDKSYRLMMASPSIGGKNIDRLCDMVNEYINHPNPTPDFSIRGATPLSPLHQQDNGSSHSAAPAA